MADFEEVKPSGDDTPCIGFAPDALPAVPKPVSAENSPTGVSTRNVPLPRHLQVARRAVRTPHWYALRTTYGREKKACDYLTKNGVEVFYPTLKSVKVVDGKRKMEEKSRFPNILFARGTEEEMKAYVYDNINLPYLRFYYRHVHEGARIIKEPLTIPESQMESLRIICAAAEEDILIIPSAVQKFETGQEVCITAGIFKGVRGRVSRFHGQQRVAVVIDGLLTVASAYVPTAFLERIE